MHLKRMCSLHDAVPPRCDYACASYRRTSLTMFVMYWRQPSTTSRSLLAGMIYYALLETHSMAVDEKGRHITYNSSRVDDTGSTANWNLTQIWSCSTTYYVSSAAQTCVMKGGSGADLGDKSGLQESKRRPLAPQTFTFPTNNNTIYGYIIYGYIII